MEPEHHWRVEVSEMDLDSWHLRTYEGMWIHRELFKAHAFMLVLSCFMHMFLVEATMESWQEFLHRGTGWTGMKSATTKKSAIIQRAKPNKHPSGLSKPRAPNVQTNPGC